MELNKRYMLFISGNGKVAVPFPFSDLGAYEIDGNGRLISPNGASIYASRESGNRKGVFHVLEVSPESGASTITAVTSETEGRISEKIAKTNLAEYVEAKYSSILEQVIKIRPNYIDPVFSDRELTRATSFIAR